MFERFTKDARQVVTGAVEAAGALGSDSVGSQHLLPGLLTPEAGAGYQVLHGAGIEADRVREVVRRRTKGRGALTEQDAEALRTVGIDLNVVPERLAQSFGPDALPASQPGRGRPRFSRPPKKALQQALREAIWLKSRVIGSEHILLGLLRCDDAEINAILSESEVTSEDLRKATLRTIGRAA